MPSAPQNLNLMSPINTDGILSITVTWRRPDPPNGRIINYTVSNITNISIIIILIAVGIL